MNAIPVVIVESNGTPVILKNGSMTNEVDPVWSAEKTDILTRLSVEENWSSWETSHAGVTSNLSIAGTEIDITSYMGVLTRRTFGATPIVYDSINNKFKANVTGKNYSFIMNMRISGELSGSPTTTSIFKFIIRRASDNSVVSFKTFAKDTVAPTTFVDEDMVSFITRVYGDTDPFVTGGFKLSLQRVAGNQTLTLGGKQQLFFVK